MKKLLLSISYLFTSLMIFATVPNTSSSNSKEAILNIEKEQARDYYLIQIYHCSTAKQIENIDLYLKNTFLPYLHKNGIEKVGVFAPLNNDTASDKKLYVWVPFKAKSSSRVYEYRSYESPTEAMHLKKVHMFNEGGEVTLFESLNFNAIFYSKVIAGSRMPNLIYMTSFNSMEDRNAHWKSFGEAPLWKKISAAPEYLNSVNRNETVLMSARDYADF